MDAEPGSYEQDIEAIMRVVDRARHEESHIERMRLVMAARLRIDVAWGKLITDVSNEGQRDMN